MYQNGASVRLFGKFRPQEEINLRLNALSVPEKQNRKELCKLLQTVRNCCYLSIHYLVSGSWLHMRIALITVAINM